MMKNRWKIWQRFCHWLGFGKQVMNECVTNQSSEAVSTTAQTMQKMEAFLSSRFEFRFNRMTEETEYGDRECADRAFLPVTQRDLNTFCRAAQQRGIACWDRDVSRFVYSKAVKEYHPFQLYMSTLPEWDGVDRVGELARRVSGKELWVKSFHRWMLAMAAGWMEMNAWHANSVAPILVSRKQGWHKSTFCKMLMPPELQAYYTDSTDLTALGQSEQKLAMFGLINLDEFDKIPARKMALLKNLMQMVEVNIRKAYRKSFRPLPRMASFIGTSNRVDLLSDPTGSRRFICVEVAGKIDCSPIDHAQLYAQLKAELLAGERYWFISEEEAALMEANAVFYKRTVEEDVFQACFRPAEIEEEPLTLSAAEIFRRMKSQNPSAMRGISSANFGKVLMDMGIPRVHTRYGNQYCVVSQE